jgi:hypothetical protein
MKEQINGMGFSSIPPKPKEGQMTMSDSFIILAILSVFWAVASSIAIASFLSKRGVKINYLFFRVLMLKYIHQYRAITMQESGRPGPWYYSFVVSMNLALLLAIVGITLRVI